MMLRSISTWFTALTILFLLPLMSQAAGGDITGWEVGSEYDKLYNPKEQDQIKGDIVKIVTITPLKGMAPGTALILDEGGGEEVIVHLCPESFASGRETGLRRGDWVKIRGAWADVGDETVFIASKVKKDSGFSFKVRLTSDGTPFWTLSEERLAMERASE
jgi:hypothetical protein